MDKATTTTTSTTATDQTHDFMNVDSFSQLPFIRPTPTTKDKSSPTASASASAIRLFGIDVSSSSAATENSDSGESTTNTTTNHPDTAAATTTTTTATANGAENGESAGRKFECHYCCRNFPTSQALGGHQNAHKRERQHAKRAHLQSAMMAADPHHHHHHLYGLVNYPHHHHHRPTNTTTNPYYPTPSYTTSTTNRYSSYNSPTTTTTSTFSSHRHTPTINGSPLAVWRIPSTVHTHHSYHRDRSLANPLPLFSGSSSASATIDTTTNVPKSSIITSMINSSQQNQVGFDHNDQFKRRATSEHVSLDLHL